MVTLVRITFICIACVAAFALSEDTAAKDLFGDAIQANSEATAGADTGSGNLGGNLTGGTQGNTEQGTDAAAPEPPAETSTSVLNAPDNSAAVTTTPSTTDTQTTEAPQNVTEPQPITQVFTSEPVQTGPSLAETAGISTPAENEVQPQSVLGQAPTPAPAESPGVEQTPAPVAAASIEPAGPTIVEPSNAQWAGAETTTVLSVAPAMAIEPAPEPPSAPAASSQSTPTTQSVADPVAGFLGVESMTPSKSLDSNAIDSGLDTGTEADETTSVLSHANTTASSSTSSRDTSILILPGETKTANTSLIDATEAESGLLAQWAANGSNEDEKPQSVLATRVPGQSGERQSAMAGLPNLPGSDVASQVADDTGAVSQQEPAQAVVATFESFSAPILVPLALSPGPAADGLIEQASSPGSSLGDTMNAIIQSPEPVGTSPEALTPEVQIAEQETPSVTAVPDSIIDDGMGVERHAQRSAPDEAVSTAPPISSLLPATGGGLSTSASVSADGAGSQVALLTLLLLAMIAAGQLLRSESVRIPQGIHVSVPTPPG